MRAIVALFGPLVIALIDTSADARSNSRNASAIPLGTMTFEEVASARAAGTGCIWLGGRGLTRRVAMKEDRGAVKRHGKIVALRPATGAREVFPYTYHHWIGGGMDVSIANSGRKVARGSEYIVTVATLTLTENGRSQTWPGRLSCGS